MKTPKRKKRAKARAGRKGLLVAVWDRYRASILVQLLYGDGGRY